MPPWFQTALTIIGSVLASSGFWAYMQRKCERTDVRTQMLIGLGHDRIVSLGVAYLDRGDWITQDEYENLNDYLYVPYEKIGGNGSAKIIMENVRKRLRIVKSNYKSPV